MQDIINTIISLPVISLTKEQLTQLSYLLNDEDLSADILNDADLQLAIRNIVGFFKISAFTEFLKKWFILKDQLLNWNLEVANIWGKLFQGEQIENSDLMELTLELLPNDLLLLKQLLPKVEIAANIGGGIYSFMLVNFHGALTVKIKDELIYPPAISPAHSKVRNELFIGEKIKKLKVDCLQLQSAIAADIKKHILNLKISEITESPLETFEHFSQLYSVIKFRRESIQNFDKLDLLFEQYFMITDMLTTLDRNMLPSHRLEEYDMKLQQHLEILEQNKNFNYQLLAIDPQLPDTMINKIFEIMKEVDLSNKFNIFVKPNKIFSSNKQEVKRTVYGTNIKI